jgi:hypothetical protein
VRPNSQEVLQKKRTGLGLDGTANGPRGTPGTI